MEFFRGPFLYVSCSREKEKESCKREAGKSGVVGFSLGCKNVGSSFEKCPVMVVLLKFRGSRDHRWSGRAVAPWKRGESQVPAVLCSSR